MKRFLSMFFMLMLLFTVSCSDDDPVSPEIPEEPDDIVIIADAGLNQNVEPKQLVTLDGTKSVGPAGLKYSWSYSGDVPESEISFENKNSTTPTFIPPVNGNYTFTLTIAASDTSDSDQVTVTVSGALKIGGILTEDMELKNIQPDASLPDYIVTEDLVVPAGITLSIAEDNVVIQFESEKGLIVTDGGYLTNLNVDHGIGFETEFSSIKEWKGILIRNGKIGLEDALIINAGKIAFDGQSEAAAVTFAGDNTEMESFSNNEFENSLSYDINVTGTLIGSGEVTGNRFSYRVPIKAPITFMQFWNSDLPNFYPDYFDFVHLIPSGNSIKDEISGTYTFASRSYGKYYIDGDFWAGSPVIVGRGCQIFVKEYSGIFAEEGFSTQGTASHPVVLAGIDSKKWRGIAAVTNRYSSGTYSFTSIINAGYGKNIFGDFIQEQPAAVYANQNGGFDGCLIINSGGFGYYNTSKTSVSWKMVNTRFENTAEAAIKTDPASIGYAIGKNHGNTFYMNSGKAAVLIKGNTVADLKWYDLGSDNFYLADTDLTWLNLTEGVHLKMKRGRAIYWTPPIWAGAFMDILGTASNPVIIEGEENVPGSWGGIYLSGGFRMNHAIIRNGGEFPLADNVNGLTANIVSAFNGNEDILPYIRNCTIESSKGWGIIIAPQSISFDFGNPNNYNTITNNTNGNIIDLN